MKAGKVWGTTEQVEANGALEFHRIEMNAGGVCSKHMHEYKWNGFFVESGKLKIKVWQKDYDLVDETIIGPGQYTKVKPGLYHQFECLESGVAFELYWAELSHNDIKRDSVGYIEEDKSITVSIDDDPFSFTLLGEPLVNDLSDVDTETITITVADD
jgi:mannose-6-phosphate isomerase-like protein (cupin superfamily)